MNNKSGHNRGHYRWRLHIFLIFFYLLPHTLVCFNPTSLTKLPYCICFWGPPPPPCAAYWRAGFAQQLTCKRRSNPAIPSKNELGNCNTVKICLKTKIVILPILVLNSQKKVSDYVSKSYYF